VRLIFIFVLMILSVTSRASELVVPERSLLLAYEVARSQHTSQSFPFTISSTEQGNLLAAHVLMKIPVSYADFRKHLSKHRLWCEFLILHLNIKSCITERQQGQYILILFAGRKHYQPPEITYRLEYRFQLIDNRDGYFEVVMDAPKGPLSTTNYRIHVQAIPYQNETVMALGLNYTQSFISRAATYSYLNTLGRNKVGFSLDSSTTADAPVYVAGVKGVIERNVMRYFLALVSYLQAEKHVEPDSFRRLLIDWYQATEQYHRQLYEYEEETYVQAKQKEYLNQRKLQLDIDKKEAKKRRVAG